MEWVFIVAVLVVLGAKVSLARSGYRRRRHEETRRLEDGGAPREAPGHLPGRGTDASSG